MKKLIQKLTETFGPSGFEGPIRDVVRAEIGRLADRVNVDALGNLIAVRKPSAGAKNSRKIMLAAHLDEIGLIATHVDERGYLRFTTLGGVRPQPMLGARVRFADGTPGVIGSERLSRPDELPPFEKLFIDVGASSRKDVHLKIGDPAVFERPFLDLGDRLVAKALDDRIGVAILIETLRQLKATPHEIYFVFTTQEEVGTRGAGTAAFGVDPDLGLAVDVTGSGDTPNGPQMDVGLGKGPAIKIKDAGNISDPRVVEWMIRTAEKARIPYQREILLMGGTDARAIQLTRAGVPAGCLSIPCRYVHTPSEMVDFNDVQNAVRLLLALLRAPVPLA